MENILTSYSILSMSIMFAVTNLISIIPIKGVQKLSQPISYMLIIFAPIAILGILSIITYKIIKRIYMNRAKIRNFFLTKEQKIQMLENLYNTQTAEYIH